MSSPADASPALWDPACERVARDLLDSAVRCFADGGFHATTTRDISIGAGLSPAALYVHFASKEAVLYEIIRVGHERALAEIEVEQVAAAPTAAAGLRELVGRYTAWHAHHHLAARVAQYELAGLAPEHFARIVTLRRATTEIYHRTVTRGVRDGSFAKLEVPPVVRGMLSLSIDLVRWYRLDARDSPQKLGELYADLAVKMVSP